MNVESAGSKTDITKKQLLVWLHKADVGSRLLPERELAANLGVSRPTLRKAIGSLVADGLLSRTLGKGTTVARTLKKPRHTICVAYSTRTDPIDYPFLSIILQYIEAELSRHGAICVLAALADGDDLPSTISQSDGVIAITAVDVSTLPVDKPVINFFNLAHLSLDASYVMVDERVDGLVAARHLTSLGHRMVAFVGDTNKYSWARDRYIGCCDALAEANLPRPLLVQPTYEEPIGVELVYELKQNSITAVVAANDYIAMSLISVLHKEGLSVPEDVSVVGFDDHPMSALFQPPLTTVKLPVREAATIAVNELEERLMVGGRSIPKKIILPSELVVRESSARLVY
jgi:DNA-binding LacI/PurR family transcriptional regulator